MDAPASVLPGIPLCKPEGGARISDDSSDDNYSDASIATPGSSMDGDDLAQDPLAEPLMSLYVDLSLAGPVSTSTEPMEPYPLYGDLDEDQYSSRPDLTDSGSDISDDTISHSSFSLDYPEQLADGHALTVSPLSTWLVKPALESQAMDPAWADVAGGQDDDKWAHEDWQLDFADEGELFF